MCKRVAVIVFSLLFCLQTTAVFGAQAKAPNPAPAGKKAPIERKAGAGARVYTSLNPSDGSFINNAKPTIAAEYVDDGIGINPAETKIYIDGVDVSAQAQASPNKVTFTPAAPLADGVHKVKVDIDDKAGNPASVTWTFTLHTKPPVIKINSHKPNQYVNQSPILVTGSVDNSNVRVMVNGVVASLERGVFSAKVNIVEGNNTITAVATDPFVNTGMDSIVVVLDSKPPTVEITGPQTNSLMNSKTVTVSGIADGKAAAVTVVTSPTRTAAVTADLAPGTFTAKEVRLEEGVNTITAKAVSRAGNSATSSIRVTVDTIPPKITLTAPKDQEMLAAMEARIMERLSDSSRLASERWARHDEDSKRIVETWNRRFEALEKRVNEHHHQAEMDHVSWDARIGPVRNSAALLSKNWRTILLVLFGLLGFLAITADLLARYLGVTP